MPRLRWVFFDGCGTRAQVDALHEKVTTPAIVADCAIIDEFATEFAEEFPWGLHDVHDNVDEWVGDREGGYPTTPHQVDPVVGPVDGALRITRGGSYVNAPQYIRSAFREGRHP